MYLCVFVTFLWYFLLNYILSMGDVCLQLSVQMETTESDAVVWILFTLCL